MSTENIFKEVFNNFRFNLFLIFIIVLFDNKKGWLTIPSGGFFSNEKCWTILNRNVITFYKSEKLDV